MSFDAFVKSQSVQLQAGLRFSFIVAAYLPSTPHTLDFARLVSGTYHFTTPLMTLYEIINRERLVLFLSSHPFAPDQIKRSVF
jgi:hypothetical protein